MSLTSWYLFVCSRVLHVPVVQIYTLISAPFLSPRVVWSTQSLAPFLAAIIPELLRDFWISLELGKFNCRQETYNCECSGFLLQYKPKSETAVCIQRSRPHKSGYFRNRVLFFFCETAFRPHETSEPHILKALSGVHFFGSDGFGYFVWTTDNAYFDVNYVINASSVSNENSRIQNGGHYIDSTMFCLQLCLLLSPFLSCAFC